MIYKLTSAAVRRFLGLYFTKPSTSPISSRVVKLGKMFTHSSRLELGNLLLFMVEEKIISINNSSVDSFSCNFDFILHFISTFSNFQQHCESRKNYKNCKKNFMAEICKLNFIPISSFFAQFPIFSFIAF